MPKKIVFCFDGTSNVLEAVHPTNVVLTSLSVAPYDSQGNRQVVYYDQGVGTQQNQTLSGGAFGLGLYANILEAYRFLTFNYEVDDEVFVFGFSRGAYTARSFVGMVLRAGIFKRINAEKVFLANYYYRNVGLKDAEGNPKPDVLKELYGIRSVYGQDICLDDEEEDWRCDPELYRKPYRKGEHPRIKIKYVGVWDTVKTLGLSKWSKKHLFHDHNLSPIVEAARHAIAIDERRKKFDVTPWDNVDALNVARGYEVADPKRPYQQLWFPGVHGGVGGGGDIRGLSDEALAWVWDGAVRQGLCLDDDPQSKVYSVLPDSLAAVDNVSEDAKSRMKARSIKKRISAFTMRHLPRADRIGPSHPYELHRSTLVRWAAPAESFPDNKQYRPENTLANVKSYLNAESLKQFTPEDFRHVAANLKEKEHHEILEFDGLNYLVHVVTKEDSGGLGAIAKRYYGDSQYYDFIVRSNKTTITNPDKIYIGQRLLLPINPAGNLARYMSLT